jgi:hypothetical protein
MAMMREATASSTNKPQFLTRSTATCSDASNPLCFAASSSPKVPTTGMLSAAADLRAALSSRTATVPGFRRAYSSTSLSPWPRRQIASGDRAGVRSTTVSQLGEARNLNAGSSALPALISVATALGITGDETSLDTSSRNPARAKPDPPQLTDGYIRQFWHSSRGSSNAARLPLGHTGNSPPLAEQQISTPRSHQAISRRTGTI